MRAVLTEPPGGLAATRITEVPEPDVDPDEVLVEIRAAALNPADRFLIDGRYPGGPQPPLTAGRDAAGIVLKADRANRFPVGAGVVVLQSTLTDLAHGTLCERQRFASSTLAPLPAGWSHAEGAAAPLVFQTAWQALTCRGEPSPETTVAVIGAGGGVGLAAVQLALGLGLRVVALARADDKLRRLRDLGVGHALSLDQPDLKRAVHSALGRKGVDIVIDTVGGPQLAAAVHLLAPRGYVAVLGVLGGVDGVVPIPSLMFKRASIHGILVSGSTPDEAQAEWRRIVDVLERGRRRPIIDRCFPFHEFAQAFARLGEHPFGKVVVEMPRQG
jgi:NADPH2:quinone reductase